MNRAATVSRLRIDRATIEHIVREIVLEQAGRTQGAKTRREHFRAAFAPHG